MDDDEIGQRAYGRLLKDLREISEARDPDDAWISLERLCQAFGFDYAGVGGVAPSVEETGGVWLERASRALRAPFDQYIDRGLDAGDPAAARIGNGAQVVVASKAFADASGGAAETAREMGRLFSSHGISEHLAVRIDLPRRAGLGILALGYVEGGTGRWMPAVLRDGLPILRLGALAYASVRRGERMTGPLTRVEARVMDRLARGMSPQEVAEDLHKSLSTVRQQIASAKARLGARSTTHAVVMAMELGLTES